MVSKQELLMMLTEAQSLEEVKTISSAQRIIRELRGMSDEDILDDVERKLQQILDESIFHSQLIVESIKNVLSNDKNEF